MNQHDRDRYRRNFEQYIYVIEFTSGVVKVGRTNTPQKRLAKHARTAQSHGVTISRSWFSTPHTGYGKNEMALIAFCAERWDISGGREYFGAADYEEIVQYANTLPMIALTEADIDKQAEHLAARSPKAHLLPQLWAQMKAAEITRESDAEFGRSDSDPLLEDIAPGFEHMEDVTADGLVAHHAAEALVNHRLRLKLNPHFDSRDWKKALAAATHHYGVALLLHEIQEYAGVHIADVIARKLWFAWNETDDDECTNDLEAWLTESDIDPSILTKMADVSHARLSDFKTLTRERLSPAEQSGEAK
jgi:hypothetical protein